MFFKLPNFDTTRRHLVLIYYNYVYGMKWSDKFHVPKSPVLQNRFSLLCRKRAMAVVW